MKLQKTRIIGSVASFALLLALTGCGSSGEEDIATAAKGPPANSNSPNNNTDTEQFGASIGVSNTCALASDKATGKPVLRVTTTIIDKSSGDLDEVIFDWATVTAMEKGKGKDKYYPVGEVANIEADLAVIETDIQLCSVPPVGSHEDPSYLGPDDTVSLNASVSVSVSNDNKPEYANRCSDDPEIDGDQGKVVVSSYELSQLCGSQ